MGLGSVRKKKEQKLGMRTLMWSIDDDDDDGLI